ncbi:MAG: MBOAT family protein [Clostridiales bacterium]|nr:MBOAT family protein [Clostridiales bacterium]
MNFSSLEFIFLFFPVFFIIYYLLPSRFRNAAVFIGSVIFYAVGTYKHPAFLIILAALTVANYALGLLIDFFPRRGRIWVSIGVVINIGSLFLFKYAESLFGGLGNLLSAILPFSVSFNTSGFILPMGLSFYAFRAVSYLADVCRGDCPAERSPLDFSVFMCMFPCLVAGPITEYPEMREQLHARSYTLDGFADGARIFIAGLGLKAILANNLSAMWSRVAGLGYDSISSPLAWLSVIAYSLYIYFDFFGYSLMAMGTGKMMGFDIPENFREPYLSLSMSDFWRRWHITLNRWFKKYIYIPLGGSRCGAWRTVFNLLVVWLFTGMWHGASLNFIIWGLVLFLIITAEKFIYGKQLEAHPVVGHIYMAAVIPLSWTVFAVTDLQKLGIFFCRLFPFLPQGEVFAVQGDWLAYAAQYGVYILLGIVCCTSLPRLIKNRLNKTLVGDIILLGVLCVSVFFLCRSAGDPFMYGNF